MLQLQTNCPGVPDKSPFASQQEDICVKTNKNAIFIFFRFVCENAVGVSHQVFRRLRHPLQLVGRLPKRGELGGFAARGAEGNVDQEGF